MSASARQVPTVDPVDEAPEELEPVPAVPTVMLTAFTFAALGAAAMAGYASWLGDHNWALTITITSLVGLSAYQAAVIALQRRRIKHLVLSVDGLIRVASVSGMAPAPVSAPVREMAPVGTGQGRASLLPSFEDTAQATLPRAA